MDDKLKAVLEGLGLKELDRFSAAEALRASTDIPVTLSLPVMDEEGEEKRVKQTCHFKAMDGQSDLDAALLVYGQGPGRGASETEVEEYWEEVGRPRIRRLICSQSVSPTFVSWEEPRGPEEVPVSVLTDAELLRVHGRILSHTDTRLHEVCPSLDISEEEQEEQYRALGLAYIICTGMNIPVIEHCWMRASREERLYAQAVYINGQAYIREQRARADLERKTHG
jgi:hypothetical protein